MGAPVNRLQLLNAVTTNVTGSAFKWTGTGVGTLHVYGTFDTATVSIQGSTDGGENWTTYTTTYSAAAIASFEAGSILVRGLVTGAGTEEITLDLVPPERE
jgi:hypothetical protein